MFRDKGKKVIGSWEAGYSNKYVFRLYPWKMHNGASVLSPLTSFYLGVRKRWQGNSNIMAGGGQVKVLFLV